MMMGNAKLVKNVMDMSMWSGKIHVTEETLIFILIIPQTMENLGRHRTYVLIRILPRQKNQFYHRLHAITSVMSMLSGRTRGAAIPMFISIIHQIMELHGRVQIENLVPYHITRIIHSSPKSYVTIAGISMLHGTTTTLIPLQIMELPGFLKQYVFLLLEEKI